MGFYVRRQGAIDEALDEVFNLQKVKFTVFEEITLKFVMLEYTYSNQFYVFAEWENLVDLRPFFFGCESKFNFRVFYLKFFESISKINELIVQIIKVDFVKHYKY